MTNFPQDFLWGAATAGHQIEGNNVNSDWWARELVMPGMESSGDACDSYHRYEEDISLLAEAGLTSYRFSLEWSRIEPIEGSFSRAELAHYRRMIEACFAHGVTPVVHCSTSPRQTGLRSVVAGSLTALANSLFVMYARRQPSSRVWNGSSQ